MIQTKGIPRNIPRVHNWHAIIRVLVHPAHHAHRRYILHLLRQPQQRRHALRWILSLQDDYFLHYQQPWLTYDAIDFLETQGLKGKRFFEYGSGGSTLYWIHRGMHGVSVEHNPAWYLKVRSYLPPDAPIDYRLVEPEPEQPATQQQKDPSNPDHYISSNYYTKNCKVSYETYVRQIDEFPDESFDLVVVDGRARPSCIKHGLARLKVGGMLILDNSDRSWYTEQTGSLLQALTRYVFAGTIATCMFNAQTSIYIRN